MKKRFGATGFFALIVAALAAFTVYDYLSSQKKEDAKENDSKIIRLNKEEITSIEVSGSKDSFHLQKVEGKWRIAAPIDESADQQAVFTYLDSLVVEKSSQTVNEGDFDLKTYGLVSPLFTLTVQSGKAKEVVKLGAIRAYDGSLYGQIEGPNSGRTANAKKVLLLSSSWDLLMSKPIKDFRDTKLYHGVAKADFDEIVVSGKLANFEILRDQGSYKLKKTNFTDPLQTSAVQAWIEQIKALRGAAFVEGVKEPIQPDYKIVLRRKNSEPYTLLIFRDKEHPAQFEATSTDLPGKSLSRVIVGSSAMNAIMVQTDAFFSKKAPFEFKLAGVTTLKFYDAKTGKSLTTDVDAAHPDDLLAKLGSLEAVRFLGPASGKWNEKKFRSHLSLLTSDGRIAFEMSWGEPVIEKATPEHPGSRYLPVKTNLSRQVVGVPEQQIAALGAQPEPDLPAPKKEVR